MKIVGSERVLFFDKNVSEKNALFDKFDFNKKLFFSSGRAALKIIAKFLKKKRINLFFPDFYCEEMLNPFKEENIKIYFYHIKKNLKADTSFFKEKNLKHFAIFITDYFGFADEQLIKESFNRKILTIRDITHSLLSNFDFKSCDIVTGSLRKIFPVPDGGFIFTSIKDITKKNLKKNSFYVEKIISKLYRYIYENYNINKEYYEKLYVSHSTIGEKLIENIPQKISIFTKNFLKFYDLEYSVKRRRENFLYLLSEKKIKNYAIFKDLPKDVVPQSFPLIIKNRDKLKESLTKDKIFLPILWRSKNPISKNIINIPVDEEYSIDDMKKIKEKFNLELI